MLLNVFVDKHSLNYVYVYVYILEIVLCVVSCYNLGHNWINRREIMEKICYAMY